MTTETRRKYEKARREGVNAINAWRSATWEPPFELEWQDYDSRATFEHEGFTIRVDVKPDDWTDMSWLGEFTDDPYDAVPNPDYDGSSRTFRYFKPTYTLEERVKDLRASGWARGPAHEEAQRLVGRDARMAVDYQEYVVFVRVEREGVELGSASLGGVGFDDDYDANRGYVQECVADLLDEAMGEARDTLARLCRGREA